VLEQLETMLALVEGWVDEVVAQATARWMPAADALAETMRRRRATGGPAEATFASLVGLELRPRRMRDAANLWAALRANRGADERDAAWSHPDIAPTTADLDDPIGYVKGERSTGSGPDAGEASDQSLDAAAFDAELAKLLDAEARMDQAGDTPTDPDGSSAGDGDPDPDPGSDDTRPS